MISIDLPGQEILERTSAFITTDYVEARLVMGLPAFGRTVTARHAEAMLFDELPQIVSASLHARNLDKRALYQHIEVAEDADFLMGLSSPGSAGWISPH